MIKKSLFFSRVTACTAMPTAELPPSTMTSTCLAVEPAIDDADADIRLVLVVGEHDLDLLAENRAAEIFDRHLGRDHRAYPAEIRIQA